MLIHIHVTSIVQVLLSLLNRLQPWISAQKKAIARPSEHEYGTLLAANCHGLHLHLGKRLV